MNPILKERLSGVDAAAILFCFDLPMDGISVVNFLSQIVNDSRQLGYSPFQVKAGDRPFRCEIVFVKEIDLDTTPRKC